MTAQRIASLEPYMPPPSPLPRPIQNLRAPYRDVAAPGLGTAGAWRWRLATFLPAALATFALVAIFTDRFAMGGLTGIEAVLIGLITVTFFWVALSVATVFVGLMQILFAPMRPEASDLAGSESAMDVALLVPCFEETTWDVFGNAAAMLDALDGADTRHRYSLYILSDTRDPALAEQELRAFATIRARLPERINVYFRRRKDNTDRKVGNLADWIEHWGGAHDAMLVLDADSLMSGAAILALSDELAADPSVGLIQSFPELWGAETLFARMQQFASIVYGATLAEGLATWSDSEGNYWGHNAIIRTAAFAASAGLPRLTGFRRRERLILSHDFVEAGLMRRAGWGVRFSPRIRGSYEEVPATLLDYVRRDRRWCQGNLQHLKLITGRGFHAVTRFHLFHGAVSYLLSPAWFLLLTTWALVGTGTENNVIVYFSGYNPQVQWPEMSPAHASVMMILVYGMLLAPKAMGTAAIGAGRLSLAEFGGATRFASSLVLEIVLAILYAPILMVQQTLSVLGTALGIRIDWMPQDRTGRRNSWGRLLAFHALETLLGVALLIGTVAGIVSLWLLPIAVSLGFAVPLSALSEFRLARFASTQHILGTNEVFGAPPIISSAREHRAKLRNSLTGIQDAAE